MTPLFPAHNGRIFIKQGNYGDCYLLAALDCIFNSGPDGYNLIKSLFTEVHDGVIVRLRHNDTSINLNPARLAGKYGYFYDRDKNQDVFFLNRARLDEIDKTMGGVNTNSLAVKILEHLSSYYYISNTKSNRRRSSVAAHNDIGVQTKSSSSIFVAKLLGLYAHDFNDGNEIIKIKTICPDQPIYIGMQYGRADVHGRIHGRHALRIDKIIPNKNKPGEYYFVLVNPWNNQLSEIYSTAELKKRNCHFAIFSTDRQKYALMRMLMASPAVLGHCVFTNPELLKMVLRIKNLLGSSFGLQDIEYCVMLHKQNQLIPGVFNRLGSPGQYLLAADMSSAKNNLQDPLHSKVVSFFAIQTELMQKQALSNVSWANKCTDMSVQKINMFSVSFVNIHTGQGIYEHSQRMITQLHSHIEHDPDLIAVEQLFGVVGIARQHPRIIRAFQEKTREILALAERHRVGIENTRAARENYGLFVAKVDAVDVQPEISWMMQAG